MSTYTPFHFLLEMDNYHGAECGEGCYPEGDLGGSRHGDEAE